MGSVPLRILANGGLLELGFDEDRYLPIPDLSAGRRLAESNDANLFVTAWVGVVDLATGRADDITLLALKLIGRRLAVG